MSPNDPPLAPPPLLSSTIDPDNNGPAPLLTVLPIIKPVSSVYVLP